MKDEILNGTFYEWDIEYCDLMGDIDDHHHEIKLKDLNLQPANTQSGVDSDGMWSG